MDLVAAARRALERVPDVRVAYLFGSRVRGDARDDSDLDVAVALRHGLGARERLDAVLDVIAALTDELGPLGERADVTDLARADSALLFHVVKDGVCVVARTDDERLELEVLAARRFDDERPWRELFERAELARARERAAGR